MSLVSAKGLFLVPSPYMHGYGGSYLTMDATGERLGNVLQIWKAGNIRKVHFRTGSSVTTADTIKATIQTVDTSGLPSGSLIDAEATGTVSVTTAATWYAVDFGAAPVAVPVTQGQVVAVVLEWNSYVAGNMRIATNALPNAAINYNCYGVSDITASPGTWAKVNINMVCIALEYDDGTFANHLDYGNCFATATSVSSSTNPDEIGNYVKYPFPCRAVGIWVNGDLDYATTFSLLNSSDTTLANCSLSDPDYRYSNAAAWHFIPFDSDPAGTVNIAKDTYYRIIATPGADAVTINVLDVQSAAAMDSLPLGSDCIYTTRVDAGAWTNTGTKRCSIGLVIDQLDNGVGGGAINLDKMGAL